MATSGVATSVPSASGTRIRSACAAPVGPNASWCGQDGW